MNKLFKKILVLMIAVFLFLSGVVTASSTPVKTFMGFKYKLTTVCQAGYIDETVTDRVVFYGYGNCQVLKGKTVFNSDPADTSDTGDTGDDTDDGEDTDDDDKKDDKDKKIPPACFKSNGKAPVKNPNCPGYQGKKK